MDKNAEIGKASAVARLWRDKSAVAAAMADRESRNGVKEFEHGLQGFHGCPESLIFRTGISKKRGGSRHLPHAFRQEGIAMLSSVLRSKRAVQVNIAIMRAFVKLREMLGANLALARKFGELEARVGGHDEQIAEIIEAIRELMSPPVEVPKKEIGLATISFEDKRTRPPLQAADLIAYRMRQQKANEHKSGKPMSFAPLDCLLWGNMKPEELTAHAQRLVEADAQRSKNRVP